MVKEEFDISVIVERSFEELVSFLKKSFPKAEINAPSSRMAIRLYEHKRGWMEKHWRNIPSIVVFSTHGVGVWNPELLEFARQIAEALEKQFHETIILTKYY